MEVLPREHERRVQHESTVVRATIPSSVSEIHVDRLRPKRLTRVALSIALYYVSRLFSESPDSHAFSGRFVA